MKLRPNNIEIMSYQKILKDEMVNEINSKSKKTKNTIERLLLEIYELSAGSRFSYPVEFGYLLNVLGTTLKRFIKHNRWLKSPVATCFNKISGFFKSQI